jgi:spore maturation protein CgeB
MSVKIFMKVLFCALKNEYGDPKRGPSMEDKSFFGTLKNMDGIAAEYFPMDEILVEAGRDEMNLRLIKKVEDWKPDLLFCFLFTEEIKKETISYITNKTKTKTFNWFGDDHWRFPVYSRYWAPLFTAVSTTDERAFVSYREAGMLNVLKTQWAANTYTFKRQDESKNSGKYGITFFGQNYGKRSEYIEELKKVGLPAEGYGRGWMAGGGKDVKEMLEIFSFSKINLNFSETSDYGLRKKINLFAKLFIKKELGKYSLNIQNFFSNFSAAIGTQRRTIKSRVFEVPACGGFLLTGMSDDDLSKYYDLDKEIVVFRNKEDLIAKSKYYLDHQSERQAIAKAGYERTVREHTYERRFRDIFKYLELE